MSAREPAAMAERGAGAHELEPHGGATSSRPAPPRIGPWITAAALLPAPLFFIASVIGDPGPMWRARYHSNREFAGEPVVRSERALSRYFDTEHSEALPGLDSREFSGRWDTCLEVDRAVEVPFMLVASGRARFDVDGEQRLVVDGGDKRAVRGAVLRLEPGVHHLFVEFTPAGWPAIGLNASFDGRAPQPLGAARLPDGVALRASNDAAPPCRAR